MHELKLENLGNQYFEDNEITSLADYVKKVGKSSIRYWKKKIEIIKKTWLTMRIMIEGNYISVDKTTLNMEIRALVYFAIMNAMNMKQT